MQKLGVPDPNGWCTPSEFEDACMAVDNAGGQTSPLYHASYLGWDELATLLIQRGASPGGSLIWTRGDYHISRHRPLSVLSGVFELTRNHNGEVERLLLQAATTATTTTCAAVSKEMLVSAQDIKLIWKYPLGKPERPGLIGEAVPGEVAAPYWDMEQRLTYCDQFAKPPREHVGLWEAIAIADSVQGMKIRDDPGNIVVHAARHRDLTALNILIREMGIDPNKGTAEVTGKANSILGIIGWRYDGRIAALETVTCSADVPDERCTEEGLELKRLDAEIAQLLISAGANRADWLRRTMQEKSEREVTWHNCYEEHEENEQFERALDEVTDDWGEAEEWYPY